MATPGKMTVTVRSALNRQPLLVSDDATAIEFRDGSGRLVVVFAKVAGKDNAVWLFSTAGDKDWEQVLAQCGYGITTVTAQGR